MTLKIHPKAGHIFICDFNGFVPPEMVKKRPVVILSPQLPNRSNLVTVVPISTTPPMAPVAYIYQLTGTYHPLRKICWVKADMIYSVSFERLEAVMVGKKFIVKLKLSNEDFIGVRRAVLAGLGFRSLESLENLF